MESNFYVIWNDNIGIVKSAVATVYRRLKRESPDCNIADSRSLSCADVNNTNNYQSTSIGGLCFGEFGHY